MILGNYQSTAFLQFGTVTLDTMFVFIVNTTIKPVGRAVAELQPLQRSHADPGRCSTPSTRLGDLSEQIAEYKIVQQQLAKNLMVVFWSHLLQSIAYNNDVHGLTGYKLPNGDTGLTQIVPLTFAAWKS